MELNNTFSNKPGVDTFNGLGVTVFEISVGVDRLCYLQVGVGRRQ